MAKDRGADRRSSPQRFRDRPRSSPASMILFTVSGVLLVTAAATAIFGNGFSDATPHEQLLGVLDDVAERQAEHWRRAGRFADGVAPLSVEPPNGVELRLVQGGYDGWEALARSKEHALSCAQSGHWDGVRVVREAPVCYREPR